MSYFPPTVIALMLVIFGILLLLSRKKRAAIDPPKADPRTRSRKFVEEDIDPESTEPTKAATFFPDKPSLLDHLDFKAYAVPLAELISQETTQTPLTVGLFGVWGSGKTTLMRMIERALKKIQKEPGSIKFVLVRFDAWKYYKEDALWRALLLRVLDALWPEVEDKSNRKLTTEEDKSKQKLMTEIERLEQSLYRDVKWEEKGGLTIDWPKLARAGAGGALKLSFSLVPGLSTVMDAVKIVDRTVGEKDLASHLDAVSSAFQRDLITHHQSQLSSIEQFQTEFSKLVRDHFKGQRLVIFVDDLDRCLPEKAIEVLEAIKLFLDVEGCVFILGIDQEVITRGLKAKYNDVGFLENGQSQAFSIHYIEKLIQLPFHLPPIEAREVQSYIDALNVAWPDANCAQIFAEGLSPNPRQIKRTINVYMLLWRLAEQRRDNLKAVTALRLAKVVILQTAYPEVFDHLKSNAPLLQQLEAIARQPDESKMVEQNIEPFLLEAVKQSSLRKLFELLAEEELASFAGLGPDELMSFFSLARKAPLVRETIISETPSITSVPTVESAPGPETRPAMQADRPFQLRAPVRDFVGRGTQLTKMITALRSETSIGVVTGMAGTGKTEFALLVAERLRSDYPDGHLFVDMRGDEKPAMAIDALSACLRAYGVNPRDLSSDDKLDELVAAYRSQLNGKRVLVLLDNVATLSQVTPLIPPQGSAILITSRNALLIPGMVNIPLDQLSPEDALTLFVSICARVPKDTAAEICELCGYLPLAIRAAAGTLEVRAELDPVVYANQLRDEQKRLELLRVGTLEKSKEASFNLSYSLLTDRTAEVFRKLAVFPETFDAKAEEIVCEDTENARLAELLKYGLVFDDTQTQRYRVHPQLRTFAQHHLSEIEREAIAKNHATYYLQVVQKADALYGRGGESSIEGLSMFDREQANIEAGFKWSISQPPSVKEAASICSQYAEYGSQLLELRKGAHERIEWFAPALNAARQLQDGRAEMKHLIDLGAAYSSLGEIQQAIDLYEKALVIAQTLNSPQLEILIHRNLGLKYRDRGDVAKAMESFERQLAIAQTWGNARGESEALISLGNLLLANRRADAAIKKYTDALSISTRIDDRKGLALALGNLGRVHQKLGELNEAIEFYERQIKLSEELGDRLGEATARYNLALALAETNEREKAESEAEKSLAIFKGLESPYVRRVMEWLSKLRTKK